MEIKQKEQLIIEIIAFFKKWALWQSVDIYCNKICYSSYQTDNSTEGVGDWRGVYIAPSSYDVLPEYMEYYGEAPQSEPLMTILFEGVGFSELISHGFYIASVRGIFDDALMFIAREEGLLYEYEEELRAYPLLDDTELESYEEYQDMEDELEEQEILQRLRETGPILCSRNTVDAIASEFHNIFGRYGVELSPIGYNWGYVCFEENATVVNN